MTSTSLTGNAALPYNTYTLTNNLVPASITGATVYAGLDTKLYLGGIHLKSY